MRQVFWMHTSPAVGQSASRAHSRQTFATQKGRPGRLAQSGSLTHSTQLPFSSSQTWPAAQSTTSTHARQEHARTALSTHSSLLLVLQNGRAAGQSAPLAHSTQRLLMQTVWAARKLAAAEWADGDLVFCTGEGKPINPNNLYRNFAAIIDRAGVPTIRLHDLRHTHATLLLSAGTPIKAVSERLGHAKTSITLDTYAHVLPDMQDRAVEAIDAALLRATV